MKKIILLICLSIPFFISKPARAGELYLNFFRNPSIGPEYKIKYFSTHIGYYPTIISKDENSEGETTSFIRTGITAWPTRWLYASVSHLYGLNGDWKDRNEMLYEIGLQGLFLSDRLALRIGVAVLPSQDFGTKVNPTPGISLRIPF